MRVSALCADSGPLATVLGASISIGSVHKVLRSAAEQAGVINRGQDLSRIRTGLHDKLFHGGMPVLAGVCAESTYGYLLAAERHRDAASWGVHLLGAARQGLKPDYTIADAGQGLRAGRRPPGAARRAMAMSSTSSTRARGSPTRCRASPKASRRGARSWRSSSAAPASLVRTTPGFRPSPTDHRVAAWDWKSSRPGLAKYTHSR